MATQPLLPTVDDLDHTVQSAADKLGVSTRTLHRYIADGKLLAYRVGDGRLRFRTSDLDALVNPARVDPLDAAVERVVAAAPTLTPTQRDRLAALLHSPGEVRA